MILSTSDVEILRSYMLGFVGLPYIYGGNSPSDDGLDCSGLVGIYLQAAGLWPNGVDAAAQTFFNQWFKSPVAVDQMRFGDLAFFGKSSAIVTHVGLVLNDRLMLEAGGGDQTVKTPEDAAARAAMVRIRPVGFRKDLVAVVRPS